ncbi:hypothetical protein IMX07_10865 [bacterium]|jgi:hypothetical protein|nr:hypothetical protein [bacterium]
MSLLSALIADGKAAAMSAEHFLGGVESEVAETVAPMIAHVRSAFVDELGYLSKQAWTAVKALVAASIEKNAAAHPNDPVGLIRAVFDDVAAQTPSIAAAGASLALHGVVTAMVAAL